jgi:hypothetical protein
MDPMLAIWRTVSLGNGPIRWLLAKTWMSMAMLVEAGRIVGIRASVATHE